MGIKKDIGFWDINNNYVEDIQEINEMDMDKYFEELNDMANFKGFGEKEETEEKPLKQCQECLCESCKQVAYLEQENVELKAENERLKLEMLHYAGEKVALGKDRAIYYQCLQEIKEIAERKMKYDFISKPKEDFAEILQKISDCEVE